MSPSQNEIRKKAKEWASVLKDPETRDAAEEAAEILLHLGFELPRIQEKDLGGKTKRGLVLANYSVLGKVINVNNNKAIKRAGGFRGYKKQAVEWGWSAQDNTILHELAHYIDSVINPDYEMVEHEWGVELDRKFVKKELSEYAATNRAEYEAELISGILRGKVYPKEILEYSYFSHLDDERAKHILALGNGTIPNDSGLPREFDKMAETVYRNPDKEATDLLADSEVRKFIDRQKLVFDNAVDTALKEVPLDEVSVQRLKESNYVFSGIKTFHELKETFPSLLDEDGNRKPFERFLNDVQKVHKTYNVQYLRTEYNFAHASALMAARWKKFEQDGDRYLLQYRTMYDKRVRRTHRMMHNITLPITSPFWDKYFPPNGWNCFKAGTPVLMADGTWKNIEDVNRGDSVIGGSGKMQLVTGTHIKPFDGEAVRIFTERGTATCTPNHRFLTSGGWVTAGNLQAGDILVQVGKVTALDVVVNAVHNLAILCRYGLMTLVRKWKAVCSLAVDGKP